MKKIGYYEKLPALDIFQQQVVLNTGFNIPINEFSLWQVLNMFLRILTAIYFSRPDSTPKSATKTQRQIAKIY